jgi:hypothetical protein
MSDTSCGNTEETHSHDDAHRPAPHHHVVVRAAFTLDEIVPRNVHGESDVDRVQSPYNRRLNTRVISSLQNDEGAHEGRTSTRMLSGSDLRYI